MKYVGWDWASRSHDVTVIDHTGAGGGGRGCPGVEVVTGLVGRDEAAKDLGVFNIAGALPYSVAPALGPAILAVGGGSYAVLYTVAGMCVLMAAVAILPVKRVR